MSPFDLPFALILGLCHGLKTPAAYLCLLSLGMTAAPAPNPADNAKVLALVTQLGSDEWPVREKASKDLLKLTQAGKANVYFVELISQSKANDPETKKPYDLETRRRCKWIVNDVLWVTSDAKKMPWPGIWHLHNNVRFPAKYVNSYDKGWEDVKKYADKHDTWYAPVDISTIYYRKARVKYNANQKAMNKWFEEIKDTQWCSDPIERLATKMLAEDLLRAGMPKREIERLLNQMLYWRSALVVPQSSGYNNEAQAWVYPKPPPHQQDNDD